MVSRLGRWRFSSAKGKMKGGYSNPGGIAHQCPQMKVNIVAHGQECQECFVKFYLFATLHFNYCQEVTYMLAKELSPSTPLLVRAMIHWGYRAPAPHFSACPSTVWWWESWPLGPAALKLLLPGESQGWGSLEGCRLRCCTESDMTEATQQQQQHWSWCNLDSVSAIL